MLNWKDKETIWATALTLAYIAKKFKAKESEWKLLCQKAKKYLSTRCDEVKVTEAANKFVAQFVK